MTGPVVLHVDLDCFYAACERLREPGLRGEPVVVGMGYRDGEEGGAVATASYEARRHGVHSAMPISRALEKLPRRAEDPDGPSAHYRPVDKEFYGEVSREVREVLTRFSDVLEPVSVDESYLDASSQTDWGRAEEFAAELKREVTEETGMTASVGVAPTKSAAKVASDREKPDGLTVVQPGDVEGFFAPLDVEEVHGVGPVTARQLRDAGIETAGDLADADPETLRRRFGTRGAELRLRVRGVDPRPVEPPGDPKSLSKEKSLSPETGEELKDALLSLADRVEQRARERGALYRTVGIKVVTRPFDVNTRERSLPGPVDDPDLMRSIVLDLGREFVGTDVRKLGVRLSNLTLTDREQSTLADWDGDGEPRRRRRRRQTGLSSFDPD